MVSEAKVLSRSLFCAVSLACVAFAVGSCKFDEYSGMMIVGDYSTKLVGLKSRKACLDVLAKNGDEFAAVAYNKASDECCAVRVGDEYVLEAANGEWSTFKKATKVGNEVDVADTITTEANIEADIEIETTTVQVEQTNQDWMVNYSERNRVQAGGVDIRLFHTKDRKDRFNWTTAEEYCESIGYNLAQLDKPEVMKALGDIMSDGRYYLDSYYFIPVGAYYDDVLKEYVWTVSRTKVAGPWSNINSSHENNPVVYLNKNTGSSPALKFHNTAESTLFFAFGCTSK